MIRCFDRFNFSLNNNFLQGFFLKTDWKYFESKILKMKYAVNRRTGELMTEDKVLYDRKELDILIRKKQNISPEIHMIKKIFNGSLI
jgi:hypothetical protein